MSKTHDQKNVKSSAEMAPPNQIQKGFLLWSSVTLLSAYIATSGLYAGQIYAYARDGIRTVFPSMIHQVYLMFLTLPMVILLLGWLAFYKYAMMVWSVSISEEEKFSLNSIRVLKGSFRISLLYLLLSWFGILFGAVAPSFLQVISGGF